MGGGDTAMEEASYLTKFAGRVHLIVRKGELRASKIMSQRILENPKAKVHYWSQVVDVLGDAFIEAIVLEDTRDKTRRTLPMKGLFIAIGHTPLTGFLGGQIATSTTRATRRSSTPGARRPTSRACSWPATSPTARTARRSRRRAWAARPRSTPSAGWRRRAFTSRGVGPRHHPRAG